LNAGVGLDLHGGRQFLAVHDELDRVPARDGPRARLSATRVDPRPLDRPARVGFEVPADALEARLIRPAPRAGPGGGAARPLRLLPLLPQPPAFLGRLAAARRRLGRRGSRLGLAAQGPDDLAIAVEDLDPGTCLRPVLEPEMNEDPFRGVRTGR